MKFEIQEKQNCFYVVVKHANGQVIFSSDGYTTKAACENGIEAIERNFKDDTRFERLKRNGNYYFNLKATNGQIIGKSQMYESASARDSIIEYIKKNL